MPKKAKAENAPVLTSSAVKICMLFKKPVASGYCNAQLTSFTGKAYWWRNVPDVVHMCPECSEEFSDMIEKWLVKKGLEKRIEVVKNEESNQD